MREISTNIISQYHKWNRIWKKIEHQIAKMPRWMQTILLDDINTAVENRIKIFEIINHTDD